MYPLPEEEDPSHEFYGWNVDYAINYWIDGGAPREKLLLGIPTYGRGFVLADANENGFYAPAIGPNAAGTCTNEQGFFGYHEFCEDIPSFNVVRVGKQNQKFKTRIHSNTMNF